MYYTTIACRTFKIALFLCECECKKLRDDRHHMNAIRRWSFFTSISVDPHQTDRQIRQYSNKMPEKCERNEQNEPLYQPATQKKREKKQNNTMKQVQNSQKTMPVVGIVDFFPISLSLGKMALNTTLIQNNFRVVIYEIWHS